MQQRRCSICRELKPLEEFVRDRSKKYGRGYRCKQCRRLGWKKYREENPEKVSAAKKAAYAKNSAAYRAYGRAYGRAHRRKHNAACRAYNRAYRRSHENIRFWARMNPEKNAAKMRAWRRAYPEKELEYKRARRAKKLAAEGSFTEEEWLAVCKKYGWRCLACGKPHSEVPLARDHIIPLSIGGTDFISNIQPLCRSCNSRKKDRYIDYRPDAYWADWT